MNPQSIFFLVLFVLLVWIILFERLSANARNRIRQLQDEIAQTRREILRIIQRTGI